MIEGESFLVIGEEWGFYPSTTEHLLRRLVGRNKFLWVHAMGCRAPQFNLYTIQRAAGKLWRWASLQRVTAGRSGMVLYSPPVLPLQPNSAVRCWNRQVMARGIEQRLKSLKIEEPILIASSPIAAEVIDRIAAKLVVYYVVDNYAEMPNWYGEYVRELDARMSERADIVFVTARPLVEKKSRPGRQAILLPQGVDFDHFHNASPSTVTEPADLAGIPRPRLVFMGLLAPWVDVDLLAEVAKAHAHASLVVLGPVRADVDQLRKQPNVFFLGQRSYEDVPSYLAHCDVGLVPFRQNSLTHYVNPLKLLEYMASGLAVVSTALPHVTTFDGVIRCASTAGDFVAQVSKALRDSSDGGSEESVAVARENSWDRRAEQFSDVLQRALFSKQIDPCGVRERLMPDLG